MPRNIDDRLSRLRARRMDSQNAAMQQRGFTESFEKRTQDKATKYALGSMQQVDARSTEISLEEGQKVERNLKEGLSTEGLYPEYRLQGSVPLNVHIRGVSDVDLLMIEGTYLRFDRSGSKASGYSAYGGRGSVADDVLYLRSKAEKVLDSRFWGAKVDKTNAKSIQLSEGGFRRKVDVVPSNWYDSVSYQLYGTETYRGVEIVNKFTREVIANYPFLYMEHIRQKAKATNEGARMAIRLSKNLKNDADDDISLSSYDIGSIFFHCPNGYITSQVARDLLVLSGAEQWLSELAANRQYAESFDTPDGTRKILDSADKWTGLVRLSREMTALAQEVEKEIVGPFRFDTPDRLTIRKRLNENTIPVL